MKLGSFLKVKRHLTGIVFINDVSLAQWTGQLKCPKSGSILLVPVQSQPYLRNHPTKYKGYWTKENGRVQLQFLIYLLWLIGKKHHWKYE